VNVNVDADFDLSRLDEIPDVIPAHDAAQRPIPPRITSGAAGPTRAVVRRQRALALLGGLAWFVAQVATLGLRTDIARLGMTFTLVQVAAPALLGAITLGIALWPGRDGLGARAGMLRNVTIAALVGLTALTLLMPPPFEYRAPVGMPPPVAWVIVCADIVFVMGAIPLAFAAAAWRRSFAVSAAERTFALGAACGLGAVTTMQLHCENIMPLHVTFGHIVPAAALALAGAFVLNRITRA
jgi:hypothetical protein